MRRRRRSGELLLAAEANPFRPSQLRPFLLRIVAADVRARGHRLDYRLVGARGRVLGLETAGSKVQKLLIALPSQPGSLRLLVLLLLRHDGFQQLGPVAHFDEEAGSLTGQRLHQLVELIRHTSG